MEKTKKLTLNLKNGTFIPFFINAARRRMPIWIVSNQSLRNIMSYYHGYKKLGRKYREVLARFPENERRNREIPPVIWVFWHQGLEKAPDLVKVCFRSVCKYMTGYEIHFLDAENMLQFVEIPEFIMEKWKRGIISHAHFSDYLRVSLLTKHGGTWIDSTVLCTGRVDFDAISNGGGYLYIRTGKALREEALCPVG